MLPHYPKADLVPYSLIDSTFRDAIQAHIFHSIVLTYGSGLSPALEECMNDKFHSMTNALKGSTRLASYVRALSIEGHALLQPATISVVCVLHDVRDLKLNGLIWKMGHGDVVDHCHHWNEIPEGLLDALRRNIFPTLHRFDIELMNDIPFDNLKCPQLVELRLSQASARSLPSTSNAVLVTPCPKLLILWLNNNESILCQDQPERCRTGQPVILLRSDTTLPEFLRSSRIREIRVAGIWGIQAESVSAILQACAPTLQHLYLPWNCELARQGQNGIYFPGFNLPTLRTLKVNFSPSHLVHLFPTYDLMARRLQDFISLLKSSPGARFEHLEFYHSSMNGRKYWKTHAHVWGDLDATIAGLPAAEPSLILRACRSFVWDRCNALQREIEKAFPLSHAKGRLSFRDWDPNHQFMFE